MKSPILKSAALWALEAVLALVVVGLLVATWMPAIWSADWDEDQFDPRPRAPWRR